MTEANPRDVTWGFGVVFSDQALDFLKADDPETHDLIAPEMERWQNMTLNHPKGRVVLDGIGFAAIGRLHLLQVLQARAEALGAELRFGHSVRDLGELDGDLLVGADGLNSLVRNAAPEAFGTTVSYMENRFAWFGARRPFDTLTQTFRTTDHGAMNAHHYRYAPDMSTFIVECDRDTFFAEGFDGMDEAQTAARCEEVFADVLEGRRWSPTGRSGGSFRSSGARPGITAIPCCWATRCIRRISPSAQAPGWRWRMPSRWWAS
ncbi:hypothetical protein ACFSZS_24005 [Seohaeicola zhoushanensis]